jgi:hypothetical protein
LAAETLQGNFRRTGTGDDALAGACQGFELHCCRHPKAPPVGRS